MAVSIPSQASLELLRRTGVSPSQLGPNATPGRALTEAFQEKLASLRQAAAANPVAQSGTNANAASPSTSANATGANQTVSAPMGGGAQTTPQVQAVHSLQGETKGDRVLNAFFQNRGEIPRGGVSMRLRAESALPTNPIGGATTGGVASPNMANALRTQAFVQEAAVGTQAARRGPAGLEEGFRTLAQGGGGGS